VSSLTLSWRHDDAADLVNGVGNVREEKFGKHRCYDFFFREDDAV
jgi:hypothetical protein